MKISSKGIELLKHHEGCELIAYPDIKGVHTIGYGNTYYENGTKVRPLDRITQKRAEELLLLILDKFEKEVTRLTTKIHLFQCQFDALVCFSYNIGLSALRNSTLLKKVLKCPADESIQDEFLKWDNAGGKQVRGLYFRRQSESYLYFKDQVRFFN